MQTSQIVAREKELSILKELELSQKSEFLAVYGRRRIGKTYLLNEHFNHQPFYFRFTGTRKGKLRDQLSKFTTKLKGLAKSQNIKISKTPSNWDEALELLGTIIKKSKAGKKIIFFDELPWIASQKSGFMNALDYFWNDFASIRPDIILVVCGSAASWMIKHLVDETGGLHNRITRPPMVLRPFTLKETQEFLAYKGVSLGIEQITELYMATGGVAYYLDRVKTGESATQFIGNNFFGPDGDLKNEFDRLFRSLFKEHQRHIEVIHALAKKPSGYSREELSHLLNSNKSGSFSTILEELEQSDFISFMPKIGNRKKEGVYRLTDEYTFFYLKWIQPLGRNNQDPGYWAKQIGKPKHHQWLGMAFENLCIKHSDKIKDALNLSFFSTTTHTFRTKTAQIDLIIDTNDKHLTLCEIKYTVSPFELTQTEANKIRNRKNELLENLKRKKQVMIALITPLPAKKNKNYIGLVTNEVNLESFFK